MHFLQIHGLRLTLISFYLFTYFVLKTIHKTSLCLFFFYWVEVKFKSHHRLSPVLYYRGNEMELRVLHALYKGSTTELPPRHF